MATRSGLAFPAAEWDEHVIEEQVPHSTALHAHLAGGGRYLTGPLARYTLNSRWLSPLAREAARAPAWVRPATTRSAASSCGPSRWSTRSRRRCGSSPPTSRPDPPAVEVRPRAGVGHGVTEAPRGTLYHRTSSTQTASSPSARIVPPTSQNQAAIEADLRAFVEARIDLDDAELTRRCEQAIRN